MSSQIVEMSDARSGATARVLVSLGFNCFSWRPVFEDGPREMFWADPDYTSGQKRPSASGMPLLFPYPGRIAAARYSYAGREYQLEPDDAYGNALHGFVHNRPWRLVEQSGNRVVGEFQASVDDASILERWPADFLIRASHELRGWELVTTVRYENCGDGPLPCGFGTHTYFRLPLADGAAVEDTLVTVPVSKLWELQQMIPTGRVLPASGDQDLASGRPLGGRKFDTSCTEVRADADGLVRTRLVEPATGRTLTQTFDPVFRHCIVFTPAHREAICLEPYTCVPDSMHLATARDDTGLQVLQPGESFETTVRLEVA
jgi:aldose 1-epimerase